MEQRVKMILQLCLAHKSTDPFEIFNDIAKKNIVRIHGPEHHILDGAVLLAAFYNAGGKIDIKTALAELAKRGMQMPGAICGMWGVCGAVSSAGAALSVIDGTGPLSTDENWGKHMRFTSNCLAQLAQTGGPRCCKRDAFFTLDKAVDYINDNYSVKLHKSEIKCTYCGQNAQCIGTKCPFFPQQKKKVAFICVHNSCRSQIAEALGKKYLSHRYECYSAGTETKPQINQDAVRLIKQLYDIDMEQTQYSKLLCDIPQPDIAISMGCNVQCPFIGRDFDDNWMLEDPTGKSDEEFLKVIKQIEEKIKSMI